MKIDLTAEETISDCKHCGSEASLHATSVGAIQIKKGEQVMPQGSLYWCRCDDNDGCGITQAAVSDRANALARWNRRAA